MSSGVAHELRQPLQAIRTDAGNIERRLRQLGIDDPFIKAAQKNIDTSIERIDQRIQLIPGHFFVEKRIIGCMMGSNRFHVDAPRYLELYRQGKLDLDAMVSRRARLDEVEDAFRAMEAGEVNRTVLTFD